MRASTLVPSIAVIAALVVIGPDAADLSRDQAAWGEVQQAEAQKAQQKKAQQKKAHKKAKRAKKKRRARRQFRGRSVKPEALRTEPVPKPSGDIWLWSPNLREEVKVNIYDEDGEWNEEALAALDAAFRCKRSGEVRAVDPRLYETLSVIYDHFGQERIELVSGFRRQRNEGSRHYHASAADIRIPGVSIRRLYKFAQSLDTGGMGIGIYPRSGFVHVDWRAPGDPSYRWTDYSGPGEPTRKKKRRRNNT